MPINRYFTQDNLRRVTRDFRFLVKLVQTSYGEYDMAIRDNYFNIYYKGNSLAKIEPKNDDQYKTSINSKFFVDTSADDVRYYTSKRVSGDYISLTLTAKQLHPFFQRKHLTQFASRIKQEHNGEEIDFEQSLITDNLDKEGILFIDRQITDSKLGRKRLDLLALRQADGHRYKFLVCEVKLGSNTELKGKVADQLDVYVEHIQEYFEDYKRCYEEHYIQKKALGLITVPGYDSIEIVNPVEGIILVGGYSGIAKKHIKALKQSYPKLKVKQFTNDM